MRDVGEFLELLHGASRAYSSVRATIRLSRNEALYREAHQRAAERKGRGRSVWVAALDAHSGSGDPLSITDWAKNSKVWFSPPSRVRCDRELEWKGEPSTAVTVIDGERWWSDSPSRGFHQSTDDRRIQPVVPELDLLEPWELIGDFELEIGDSATCAGRQAVTALATVRELRTGHVVRVAPGADQYELTADLERGVLLRCAALLEGAPFEVSEITEIAFDEEIDPDLFRLEPPPEGQRRQVRHLPRSACNFCGKSGEEVEHLVVGSPVYICNECVGISRAITSKPASDS